MTTDFTESSIIRTLVHPFGVFPPRRWLCVDNVSWGFGLPWEADLIAVNQAGYITEVEVKISLADLKRDAGKRKHRMRLQDQEAGTDTIYTTKVRAFWYAMPRQVWEQAAAKLVAVREDAGIILVYADPGTPARNIPPRLRAEIARKPKLNPKAKKIALQGRYKLARLGTLRYWDVRT